MKKLLLSLAILCLSVIGQAQFSMSYAAMVSEGTPMPTSFQKMQGNNVIGGLYQFEAQLAGVTLAQNNPGISNGFLAVLDSENEIVWHKTVSNGSPISYAQVLVDEQQNVHWLVGFENTLQVDGYTFNTYGGQDLLWLTFDSVGYLQSYHHLGTVNNELLQSWNVDDENQFVLTLDKSVASSHLYLNQSLTNLNSSKNCFLVFDNGQLVESGNIDFNHEIENLRVGKYNGNLLASATVVSNNSRSFQLIKLNQDRQLLWKVEEQTAHYSNSEEMLLSDNVIAVYGSFNDSLRILNQVLGTNNFHGHFLSFLDQKSNLKNIHCIEGMIQDAQMSKDQDGSIYLYGNFSGSLKIGQSFMTHSTHVSFFVAKFSSSGEYLEARAFETTEMSSIVGVHFDIEGNITFVGLNQGTLDLGGVMLESNVKNIFIATYNGSMATNLKEVGCTTDVKLFPNVLNKGGLIQVVCEQAVVGISVYNVSGQHIQSSVQVLGNGIDTSLLPSGIHIIRLSLSDGTTISKSVQILP